MGGMNAQQQNMKANTYQNRVQNKYQDKGKAVGVAPENWKQIVKRAVWKYARAQGYLVSTQAADGQVKERVRPEHLGDLNDMYDRLYTILKLNESQIRNWQARPNQSFIITESDLVYALYRVALFIKNFPEAKDAVDKIYIIPNASVGTLVVYPHYLLLADIFMKHANIKYYRFQVDTENGNLKSATVKFYVDGVDGSLDFTVFVSDLALLSRLKDKQSINTYPNLTVMLCKQALRQGLALYFPSVAIQMAISVDNFVGEDEYLTDNRGVFETDRGTTFVVNKPKPITNATQNEDPAGKPKPITNPPKHENAGTQDLTNNIRLLLTKIHAQYNNDNDFMKFLGNRIRETFNISQAKLTDPTIPSEVQNAIVDYLSDQPNIETLYKSYQEIVKTTQSEQNQTEQ
jgi:hypothetical protein